MKYRIVAFLFLFIFFNCTDDEPAANQFTWKKLGLEGMIVNELVLRGNVLYAATDKGVYKKDINASATFTNIGFENMNMEDILVYDDNTIIATFVDRTFSVDPALYISGNGGESWEEIENNFGGEDSEPVFDLAAHPDEENTIYGTGYGVVAKSTDRGVSWDVIWGDWQGFATGVSIVILHPQTKAVWAGGQGAIENGFLLYSANESHWTTWDNLVPNPTVVKEIVFDEQNVYAGFEGALVKSVNSGTSWETLIDSEENRFFFGIAVSSQDNQRVFTGGWIKTYDSQPLKIYFSENGGNTFEESSYPDEEFGGIYDMALKSEPGKERIFLGLYKGGVYEVVVTR